jgi:uncharacterized membrane protein required for colicin V production
MLIVFLIVMVLILIGFYLKFTDRVTDDGIIIRLAIQGALFGFVIAILITCSLVLTDSDHTLFKRTEEKQIVQKDSLGRNQFDIILAKSDMNVVSSSTGNTYIEITKITYEGYSNENNEYFLIPSCLYKNLLSRTTYTLYLQDDATN